MKPIYGHFSRNYIYIYIYVPKTTCIYPQYLNILDKHNIYNIEK